jgi:hypothetical protein
VGEARHGEVMWTLWSARARVQVRWLSQRVVLQQGASEDDVVFPQGLLQQRLNRCSSLEAVRRWPSTYRKHFRIHMDTHDEDATLKEGRQYLKYKRSLSAVWVQKDHQCPVRDCPTFRPSSRHCIGLAATSHSKLREDCPSAYNSTRSQRSPRARIPYL